MTATGVVVEPTRHVIPCCYELGPDLEHVARVVGLSPDEVVRLHCEVDYTVYAIGFCPGFAFLGYLEIGAERRPATAGTAEEGRTGKRGTDRPADGHLSARASGRLESHRKNAVSPGRCCGELLSLSSRRPCPI